MKVKIAGTWQDILTAGPVTDPAQVSDLRSPAKLTTDEPQWTSQGTIWTVADSSAASMLWPCLVYMGDFANWPYPAHPWAIYHSTDHGGASGAIYLITAATPAGPYTDRGLIYQDTTAGTETETPTVFVVGDEVWMYYQQLNPGGVATQSTLLAKSSDGETFTRFGIVIDVTYAGQSVGDLHTGYAKIHRIGGRWIAHHLLGGSNTAAHTTSYSDDGETWVIDPRPMSTGQGMTGVDDRRLTFQQGNFFLWRGRTWWIGPLIVYAYGADPRTGHVVQAPASSDLRHIVAPPTYVTDELTSLRDCFLTAYGSTLYLVHTSGTDNDFVLWTASL